MIRVLALAPQPLIDMGEAILRFFHDELGFSWGAAIIGMTVVVRLAILPLTYKGVRGMQAMQRLSPEVKRIQERHKDDKQLQQQEMMKLWQEHKVNPASACLPLLLQLPFFIALFDLLRGAGFRNDIRGEESFLFISHLAKPESGAALVILILLYVVTMLASSLVTMISADATQRRIFLALPIVFIPFILQFPAGLLVYWITTNVWTIGQQLAVKKLLPLPEPLAPSADEDGKGDPAKAAIPASASAGGERRRFGFLDALNPSVQPREQGDGKAEAERPAPARAEAGGDGARKAPPRSPRKKKKKRSGRRR